MAKAAGRLFYVKKNGTNIAGLRNVSISGGGTPIDVTDQGDSGYNTYLSNVMTGMALEFTGSGIEEDQVLHDAWYGGVSSRFMTDITVVFPNGDTLSGDVVLTAYSETGAYEDAQTFDFTFSTDGTWTFTAA